MAISFLWHQETVRRGKNKKCRSHQIAAACLETPFRTLIRASSVAAQGTVASPARLPDSGTPESLLMLITIIYD